MAAEPESLTTRTAAQAEPILAARFNAPFRLGNGLSFQASKRSRLFRFDVLDGPVAAPTRVFVKRIDAEAPSSASPLLDEWAGLDLLGRLIDVPAFAPRCYGGDGALGLVVMEDLGEPMRLDQILLGAEPATAERGLTDMARALGHMNGATARRRDEYASLRSALGPKAPATDPAQRLMSDKAMLAWLANHFGLPDTEAAQADVDSLAALFRDDHPYWTYIHGDPCPDNWLLVDDGIRLVDFEFGGFGNALRDGVVGRMHFPTCWCANGIPEPVLLHMEQAYRDALATHLPAAQDDLLYARTYAQACALHTLATLRRYVSSKVRRWGIATLQQRAVLHTTLLAEQTERQGHLVALGQLCRRLAVAISQAGEGSDPADMPRYPAFRGASAGV